MLRLASIRSIPRAAKAGFDSLDPKGDKAGFDSLDPKGDKAGFDSLDPNGDMLVASMVLRFVLIVRIQKIFFDNCEPRQPGCPQNSQHTKRRTYRMT
jgi:hypothetical protein